MRVTNMPDGGVVTEPETDAEKAAHEAAVAVCIATIKDEVEEAKREFGSVDMSDFRDVGLPEAREELVRQGSPDPDEALNAVCCDRRVQEELDRQFK